MNGAAEPGAGGAGPAATGRDGERVAAAMRRWIATLGRDVRLQARYGLYAVSVLVVAVLAALLSLLSAPTLAQARLWAPAFVIGNLIVTTFFFMAASVLLERDEGTVTATVTTPLRDVEYLGSKTATLALLGLLENGAVVVFFFGWPPEPVAFAGGLLLAGALYALAGFVSVARYASINRWLMPSVVWITLLLAPLLGHFEILQRRLFLWHPVEPAMVLLRAGYGDASGALALYGWGPALAWTLAAGILARRSFARWVSREAGIVS